MVSLQYPENTVSRQSKSLFSCEFQITLNNYGVERDVVLIRVLSLWLVSFHCFLYAMSIQESFVYKELGTLEYQFAPKISYNHEMSFCVTWQSETDIVSKCDFDFDMIFPSYSCIWQDFNESFFHFLCFLYKFAVSVVKPRTIQPVTRFQVCTFLYHLHHLVVHLVVRCVNACKDLCRMIKISRAIIKRYVHPGCLAYNGLYDCQGW